MRIPSDTYRELLMNILLADFHPTLGTKDMYAALFVSEPGSDGSGTEVTGGGYARVLLDFSSWNSDSDKASYDDEIDFGTALSSWGEVTHWAIMDASTGGDVVVWGEFGGHTPDNVETDAIVKIMDGTLTISFSPDSTSNI